MKEFQYHQPETIAEACALMSEFGNEACILAGGTDLIVKMKKHVLAPRYVVNIKKVRELDFIQEMESGFILGALTSLSDIAEHPGLGKFIPILASSARSIGSSQVRNLATLGGNLCNAAPSADMAPSLLVMEATVKIIGPTGSRSLALEKFFKGPGEVDLAQGELLAEVRIPLPAAGSRMIYLKHGPRKAMDIAVVGVAVALSLDEATTRCEKARIALGAVSPTPARIRKAEALLEGKKPEEIQFSEVAEAIQRGIKPISDVRGSAEYRSDVAAALTIRALTSLINAAEG